MTASVVSEELAARTQEVYSVEVYCALLVVCNLEHMSATLRTRSVLLSAQISEQC